MHKEKGKKGKGKGRKEKEKGKRQGKTCLHPLRASQIR